MLNRFTTRLGSWLAMVALAGFLGFGFGGAALAQTEPTMSEIYQMAQSGKLDQAQTMVQQVLVIHPNSARAHFVQAELYGRQGQAARGRDALAAAEKIAPGLPFAKPEAVQALRTQLASKSSAPAGKEPAARSLTGAGNSNSGSSGASAAPAAPTKSSFPIGLGLALGGAAIAFAIFMLRKKPAARDPFASGDFSNPNAGMGNPGAAGGPGNVSGSGINSGLSGPQTFGNNPVNNTAYGQPGNPQQFGQYGQPQQTGYGAQQPAAGSGMGGRVMGGLATGLAVGAGVMAAQAIGKNLIGNANAESHPAAATGDLTPNNLQPLQGNSDMGGQNFGINDTSSWDDGGSSMSDSGGGGDWDT